MSPCILNVLFSLQLCLPISPLIGSWELSAFLPYSDFFFSSYLNCLILLLAKVETHFLGTVIHTCAILLILLMLFLADNVKFIFVSQMRLSCFCIFYLFSNSLIFQCPFLLFLSKIFFSYYYFFLIFIFVTCILLLI